MKKIYFIFTPIFVLVILILAIMHKPAVIAIHAGVEESNDGYEEWFQQTLADPNTGKIPDQIFQQSLTFSASLPVVNSTLNKADFGIWVQRGPDNVGGRTRTLSIDVTNEFRLIAGAVSGGIWKSEDQGTSWQKMSADTDFVPVTSIVQDTRKGKTNTWYAGTGEIMGVASEMDYMVGNGVRKSTDNGKTWQRLLNTYSLSPYNNSAFNFVHRLAINPKIDSLDVIFAATQDGIFRSNDGGKIWLRRRGGTGGYSSFTDVAIDKNGIVYAALDAGGAQGGIWRSKDNGQTWANISPTWFDSNVGRIVMDISPSDQNQIYFFAFSPGIGKKTNHGEWHSLWKYIYKSGDGTGTGGVWENRSNNLPSDTTNSNSGSYFSSQHGYDLLIKVKPDNPDVIFLGGVSLFRSNDGFITSGQIAHIGGQKLNLTDNDLQIGIPNQHGDEHGLVFFPSDSKKAITLSDGGIEYTNDISATTIDWQSMNHGYVTTQFYSVGIDHQSTGPMIFAGAQDNGIRVVNDMSYTKPWVKPSDGDGMGVFSGVGADDYYFAFQQGWLARFKLDADLNLTQIAYIQPKNMDDKAALFFTSYVVDESDRKRIYYANGPNILRNNDVTQIPFRNSFDTTRVTTGWTKIVNAITPDTSSITHITYGKAQTDVIYYGTISGKLLRLRDASTLNPIRENITGNNFPSGYITCITADENDSNKIFCVFSNFGILSVFCTVNGGTTWTPVSGNLEQYSNGTGVGPSCRWLTIAHLPDTTLYFLGTTTGLYATGLINGMNTVWTLQGPHNIGLNWVTMMDFRTTDYTMAVATFGAGIYSTQLSSKDRTGIKPISALQRIQIYPNPVHDVLHISMPYPIHTIQYTVYDLNGRLIAQGVYKREDELDVSAWPPGNYLLRLTAGNEVVTKRIIVE